MSKVIQIAIENPNLVPVDALTEFQGELKVLSVKRYEALKQEIVDHGFSFAVHVWPHDGKLYILDGHQRTRTVRKMVKEEGYSIAGIPIVRVMAVSYEEAKRKLIAAVAQYGEVTEQGMYEYQHDAMIPMTELEKYPITDINWDHYKKNYFEDLTRDGLIVDEKGPDPDVIPPPPKIPISRPGDLWLLGEHRLLCGDSTDPKCITKVMQKRIADLVFTDPPYGVSYVGKTKDAMTIENDALDDKELYDFLCKAFQAWPLKEGGSFYVCSPAGNLEGVFRQALKEWLRQSMVWVKDRFVMGRQDYHWRHETILYGWKIGSAHYFVEDRTQDTVWEIKRPSANLEHPTMKPIELIDKAMLNSSLAGALVFDGFAGSGSTLISAQKNGRLFAGVELDPIYADVIVNRWQEYTGKKATREDGALYDYLKEQAQL